MGSQNVSLAADAGEWAIAVDKFLSLKDPAIVTILIALTGALLTKAQLDLLGDVRNVLLVTAWLCRQEIWMLCVNIVQTLGSWLLYGLAAPMCFWLTRLALSQVSSRPQQAPRSFLPALILPCHTTHTRFFPAKHTFTYSYLQVGIPVGWRHDSGILSCDPTDKPRGWFSVHNEDYLARGSCAEGLRGKLDDYLRRNDVAPADLPCAYLVTAPRFLGWSFNPVSFWYLYDADKILRAMILEVNNTFDERRMYLLRPEIVKGQPRFRETWQKDFHVSPFNDRKGEYSMVACDPFEGHWTSVGQTGVKIDNNITLSTLPPDSKPKLVARIYSTSSPVDPSRLGMGQLLQFMVQWCWTGFLTNPRILWEARILWAKKKLQVFYRPEVNIGSIGRQEQQDEVVMEEAFRCWLEDVGKRCSITIGYTSAAGTYRGRQILLGETKDKSPNVVVEVLTPEWYAELARSQDVRSTFEQRCVNAIEGEGEQMLSVRGSHASVLSKAFDEKPSSDAKSSSPKSVETNLIRQLNRGAGLLTAVIRVLLSTFNWLTFSEEEEPIHTFRDMVGQVSSLPTDIDHATLMIVLADRYALGYTGLLRLYPCMFRWVLILMLARYLAAYIRTIDS